MHRYPTPVRLLGPDVIATLSDAMDTRLKAKCIILVCDTNTWVAAGEQVHARLRDGYTVLVNSLGRQVKPTHALASELAAQAQNADVLLAVGSGTVNDLTKFAAHTLNKPYAVIATAASMNGYTSANASLEKDGHKQSFAARPPVLVVGDKTILANAPKRLMRAGLGDTLARSTTEADMLLSHRLLGTPYPRNMFDILRRQESILLKGSMNSRDNEAEFLDSLFESLLDAGDAMAAFGDSSPASQGEHMIAHTLELKYGGELHDVMHGELIAITSLTMSQLQHRVLLSLPAAQPMPYNIDKFEHLFGKQMADGLAKDYAKKVLTTDRAHEINLIIEQQWPAIKAELAEIMLPTNTLERALIHSAVYTKPSQIGLEDERYRFATSYAYLTRNRFTFLDLAAMGIKRLR